MLFLVYYSKPKTPKLRAAKIRVYNNSIQYDENRLDLQTRENSLYTIIGTISNPKTMQFEF